MKKYLILLCTILLVFLISGMTLAECISAVTFEVGWGKYFDAKDVYNSPVSFGAVERTSGINASWNLAIDNFKFEVDLGMHFYRSTVNNWAGDVQQDTWVIKGEYIFIRNENLWQGVSLSYKRDYLGNNAWYHPDPIVFSSPMVGIEANYSLLDKLKFNVCYDTSVSALLLTDNSNLTGPSYINTYNLKLIYVKNNHWDFSLGYRFSSHQFLNNGEPAAIIYNLYGIGITYKF